VGYMGKAPSRGLCSPEADDLSLAKSKIFECKINADSLIAVQLQLHT
jgi:hypothetical protein